MLQPPFYDTKADSAINYGAIGSVIGHELTHGFDSAKDLSPVEAAAFDALASRLSRQYSSLEPLPGAHVKGDLTLRENIADLGGLTIALAAYHAALGGHPAPIINGFNGDQRVFLGWALGWRVKDRDDRLRTMIASDPHAPPSARVNGVVRNLDAWYEALQVTPGRSLYVAPRSGSNLVIHARSRDSRPRANAEKHNSIQYPGLYWSTSNVLGFCSRR